MVFCIFGQLLHSEWIFLALKVYFIAADFSLEILKNSIEIVYAILFVKEYKNISDN